MCLGDTLFGLRSRVEPDPEDFPPKTTKHLPGKVIKGGRDIGDGYDLLKEENKRTYKYYLSLDLNLNLLDSRLQLNPYREFGTRSFSEYLSL